MWYPHPRFKPVVALGMGLFVLLALYRTVVAQTWFELFPSGNPPPSRWSAGTAYDASTDRLILFSGEDNSGVHPHPADVWILMHATEAGGTPSWVQLFPVGSAPPGRLFGAVAYDPINNRLIVHGGCLIHCTPVLNDTWVLTNANGLGGTPTWIALPPAPIARSGTVAAYDPGSNRMIVFGGATGFPGTDRNDVWVLTNANGIGASAWVQLFPTGGPPPVRGETASGVYDPASNRLIIFGGSTTTGVHYNDVWVLSHANGLGGTPQWTQLSPLGTLPAVRNGHALLYDAASNRLIVFGGSNTTDFLNDVWVLTEANGTGGTPTWTMLTPTGGPPIERTFASAGYASASNRMVVALGSNDTEPQGLVDDVWMLDFETAVDLCSILGNCGFESGLIQWTATKKNKNYRFEASVVNPVIIPKGKTSPLEAPVGNNFIGILNPQDADINGRLVHAAVAQFFPAGTVFEVTVWANRGRLQGARGPAFESQPSEVSVQFFGWGAGSTPVVNPNTDNWSRTTSVNILYSFTNWGANGEWASQTFEFTTPKDLFYVSLAITGKNHIKATYAAFDIE